MIQSIVLTTGGKSADYADVHTPAGQPPAITGPTGTTGCSLLRRARPQAGRWPFQAVSSVLVLAAAAADHRGGAVSAVYHPIHLACGAALCAWDAARTRRRTRAWFNAPFFPDTPAVLPTGPAPRSTLRTSAPLHRDRYRTGVFVGQQLSPAAIR